jgi:hypothetical protein
VDDRPIFEVTYQRPDGLKYYIVGDGSAKLVIDPFEYRPQYLIKTIVRQM